MKTDSYLVIDMTTGLMDGKYMYKDDAIEMLNHHRQRRPQGEWIVAEVDHSISGNFGLPDKLFWARNE